MASIRPLFFILAGLIVASVTQDEMSTMPTTSGNNSTPVTHSNSTTSVTRNISISSTTGTMNITISPATSTIEPSATMQKGNESTTTGPLSRSTMSKMTLIPTIYILPKSTISTTTRQDNPGSTSSQMSDNTGFIILVVIILVALGFGVACYFARRRARRYSVDFTSRPDEADIPLSTVEPEVIIDAAPQNGLQTFENVEAATKEPEEAEAKPEAQEEQEEQKAEADKSVVDPSAESAAPPPAPDSSEDKPKEADEESPPAPVEPSAEEKTDDEGVVSNKTSMESLKETNENNSNSAALSQQRDLNLFWDVPLDRPV